MKIHDPFAHTERELTACQTLPPIGEYELVESSVFDNYFLVYTPTGKTIKLEEADDVLQRIAHRRIALSETHHDTETIRLDESAKLDPCAVAIEEGIFDPNILKAVFVAGSGGAGKGQVVRSALSGIGMKVINQDKHLERFLKDAKIPLADAGQHYELFNKARDLKDKELRHYAGQRLGLVIDSTGWSYDRIAGPVKKLKELGYDVSMVFVDVSLETALKRNSKRAKAGGRDVPDSFIADAQRGAARNLRGYMKLFGRKNFMYLDNDKNMGEKRWNRVVGTGVQKFVREILKRPVRNAKGRKWLKVQMNPKTSTANDPNAPKGWPAPKTPKGYQKKLGQLYPKQSKVQKLKNADLIQQKLKQQGKKKDK